MAAIEQTARRKSPEAPLGGVRAVDARAVGQSASKGDAAEIRRKASMRAKILVPTFLVCLHLPIFFYFGPVRMAPYLMFLAALTVPLMIAWLSKNFGKIKLPDVLMLGCCVWQAIALGAVEGFGTTLEPIGLFFLQTFGAYLVGRACIRGIGDLRLLATLLFIQAAILFPFAFIETTTTRTVFLDLFRPFIGTYMSVFMEPRMGFDRVQGSFEHPILFGVFMAFGFSLQFYRFRSLFGKAFTLPVTVFNTMSSLSTGALLALIVQFGLLAWSKMFREGTPRWRNLTLLLIAMYLFVDLASNRTPFNVFVDYLTFNSGSAYNRILIWQFGTAEVARHPFFGIGFADWERPTWMSGSMDNFWLVIAVRYGLPAFLMMAAAMFLIMYRAGRRVIDDEETLLLRRGMIMGGVGVMFAICSVHLWNSTYAWLMFYMGATVWIMDQGRAPDEAPDEVEEGAEPKEAARPKPRAAIGDLTAGRARD